MRRQHLAAAGAVLALGLTLGAVPASADPGSLGSSSRSDQLGLKRSATLDKARAGAGSVERSADIPPYDGDYYFRIHGSNRYATAVQASYEIVCGPTEEPTTERPCYLGGVGQDPVEVVFVANGVDFPDALGAGPVAAGLGPLLLVPPTGTVPTVVKNELNRIKPKYIVIFGGTGAVSQGVEDQLKPYAPEGVDRIAGSNRFDTAAQAAIVNDQLWRNNDEDDVPGPDNIGIDTIVLASGAGFADALGGGGAAANSRGSLMLTAKDSLPAPTKAALQQIKPKRVIVLGGTGVVSTAVENAVRAALPAPATTVVRAAGSNRFGTAIALSKVVFPTGAPEVFVVNGFNFPDALASAPAAGVWGASTLVSNATCVPSGIRAEADRLDPVYVTGFGGEGVLSDNAILLVSC